MYGGYRGAARGGGGMMRMKCAAKGAPRGFGGAMMKSAAAPMKKMAMAADRSAAPQMGMLSAPMYRGAPP